MEKIIDNLAICDCGEKIIFSSEDQGETEIHLYIIQKNNFYF